ncbi:Abi family protein [Desulfoplanes sp.]
MHFSKINLSVDDQIAHLASKNLSIPDAERARRYLTNIGYYRLKAYAIPFYILGTKSFHSHVCFDDILRLYIFDRKLRSLLLDALDRIEIAVRSVISNTMCEQHGPHWFLDRKNFSPWFQDPKNSHGFGRFYREIEKATHKNEPALCNPSCKHYYQNYSHPPVPPSWIIAETLTMGSWSRVFSGLRKTKYKKIIAGHFGFDQKDFASWTHALTLVRNICAHHQRFWNRNLPPKAQNVAKYTHRGINPGKAPYCNLAIVFAFLCSFTNASSWNVRLAELLEECPLDIHEHMGFPRKWQEISFWNFGG